MWRLNVIQVRRTRRHEFKKNWLDIEKIEIIRVEVGKKLESEKSDIDFMGFVDFIAVNW